MAEPDWGPLTKKALREVLGGGSDIDAGNPLPIEFPDDASRSLGYVNRAFLRSSLFNQAVTANTDIFSPDLATVQTFPVTFRFYVCFVGAGALSIQRTAGGVTVAELLNAGANLTAGAAYTFDIIVESGEDINLQYSINTTANVIKVVEIRGM